MNPGDRVRVTDAYGERFPYAARYVGEEGTLKDGPAHPGYLRAALDCDGGAHGLFRHDELAGISVDLPPAS